MPNLFPCAGNVKPTVPVSPVIGKTGFLLCPLSAMQPALPGLDDGFFFFPDSGIVL
jgi:hypothetical protein